MTRLVLRIDPDFTLLASIIICKQDPLDTEVCNKYLVILWSMEWCNVYIDTCVFDINAPNERSLQPFSRLAL